MKHIFIILFVYTIFIQLWLGQSAKFLGSDLSYAKALLNRNDKIADKKTKRGQPAKGHARMHVLRNVVKYSLNTANEESAFQTSSIQDDVLRRMIGTTQEKATMLALNKENNKGPVSFSAGAFQLGYTNTDIPKVVTYKKGIKVQQCKMAYATVVLGHKLGQKRNINAEVVVYTLYPSCSPKQTN